jgi:hypothetical protein
LRKSKYAFYLQQRLSKNLAAYELMREKYDRAREATEDNIILYMPDNKGMNTDTHAEYVILNYFSKATMIT